jgi:hypothetical protein
MKTNIGFRSTIGSNLIFDWSVDRYLINCDKEVAPELMNILKFSYVFFFT